MNKPVVEAPAVPKWKLDAAARVKQLTNGTSTRADTEEVESYDADAIPAAWKAPAGRRLMLLKGKQRKHGLLGVPTEVYQETPEDVTVAAIARDQTVWDQALSNPNLLNKAFEPIAADAQSNWRWLVVGVLGMALHKRREKPPGKHLPALVANFTKEANHKKDKAAILIDYAKWLLTIDIGAVEYLQDRLREFGDERIRKQAITALVDLEGETHRNTAGFIEIVRGALQELEPSAGGVADSTVIAEPKPLAEAALHGLAGDFVRLVGPQSEADPAALLVHFLVAYGNVIGRSPHFAIGANRKTKQHTNLYAAIVGQSSKARKGTAWQETLETFQQVAEPGGIESQPITNANFGISGLASGEGLIWAVRDDIEEVRRVKEKGKPAHYEPISVPGVHDKRLLVVEPEFARTLRLCNQETNTTSPVIRQGFDGGNLDNLTKHNRSRATNPHISIIGHITQDELCRVMPDTAAANGFANRFLWVYAKRSKKLPRGGAIDREEATQLAQRIAEAVEHGRGVDEALTMSEKADTLWDKEYRGSLSAEQPGLLGAITARGEAHVLRLAILFALLEKRSRIQLQHLRAALEVWRYCFDSARYIFGEKLGYPLADRILEAIRKQGRMTRNEIFRDVCAKNTSAGEIDRALAYLAKQRLLRKEKPEEQTGPGRPTETWVPCDR